MATDIGVGIVGYGFIGKVHALAYREMPLVFSPFPYTLRMVGVATANAATAEAARAHGGFDFGTDDYRQLLERPDISAVSICTPNHTHHEIAMAALRAGKHVYCDKPLAISAAQAREMLGAAHDAGRVNMITFQNRFSPAALRAAQIVAEGRVGRVYQFRAQYLHSGYADAERPSSWRLQATRSGGGALFDLASHAADLVRCMLGEFDAVSALLHTFVRERPASAMAEATSGQAEAASGQAEARMVPVDVDDACILQVRMANGAIGVIEASRFATGCNDDLRFEIHGEKGALRFCLMDPNYLEFYDNAAPSSPIGGYRGFTRIETVQRYDAPATLPGPKCPVGWTRFHTQSMWAFVSAIGTGASASPSFIDGLAVQELLESALESGARDGAWVKVRPPRC